MCQAKFAVCVPRGGRSSGQFAFAWMSVLRSSAPKQLVMFSSPSSHFFPSGLLLNL